MMPSPVYWFTVALEAVHPVGEQLGEAFHHPVVDLGVELLGQLHRALHVGEEHGHVLSLFRAEREARI
jgi:hypothetical protein